MNSAPLPITILTLNPAVDMTYEVEDLVSDQKMHATATRFDPGGNGINVARALHRLNVPAHSFVVLAGKIGSFLEDLLREQVDMLTVEQVTGETRINGTALVHHTASQYEISGIGPAIPDEVLAQLTRSFVANTNHGYAVITGSIQPSLPTDLYADLVERVQSSGGKAIVDAQGELLKQAIEARPFLIKPNHYELEQLTGQSIDGIEAVAQVARDLNRAGVEILCVSLGSQGVVMVDRHNAYHAHPPKVTVDSTVGAGDSMVAGLVAGLSQNLAPEPLLRLAVACSAGTVRHPGTELFYPEEVPELSDQVTIRTLDI